jgi:hypothetical protein
MLYNNAKNEVYDTFRGSARYHTIHITPAIPLASDRERCVLFDLSSVVRLNFEVHARA